MHVFRLSGLKFLVLVALIGLVAFVIAVWKGLGTKSLNRSHEPPWKSPEYKAKWRLIEPFLKPNRTEPLSERELQLLRKLSQDPLWIIRGDAVIAISFLPPHQRKEMVGIVIERLKDPHPYVRDMALIALARMKAKEAVPHIMPLLNDPDDRVRQTARKALSSLGYEFK